MTSLPRSPIPPRRSLPSATSWTVRTVALVAAAVASATPLPAQSTPPDPLAAAESALAHGARDEAVRLALNYTGRHPGDEAGWLLLGRARLTPGPNFPSGEPLQAVWAFRRASDLTRGDTTPLIWMGRAAMTWGGADGESVARQAWERVLTLLPGHQEAWAGWLSLTRYGGERERMRRVLGAHPTSPLGRLRIARLLIEDEQYPRASLLLDSLLAEDPGDASALALRAQSAFEGGEPAVGERYYAEALRHASRDAEGILWAQAIGIATPDEIRAWEAGIAPAQRGAWLAAFWARRDPDLFRSVNVRIAEHFARLRYARRHYPLAHALTAYHRTSASRAAELIPSQAEELFYLRCEAQEFPGGPMRARDRARLPFEFDEAVADTRYQAGVPAPGEVTGTDERLIPPIAHFAKDLRNVDTTAARVGYNRRTGLDDRGLTWLRLGQPAIQAIGAPNTMNPFCNVRDLERWDYAGMGQIRFFRPSALFGAPRMSGMRQTSDMVMRAQNEEQFQGMTAALTRDTTSIRAPLEFGVWTAQFRSAAAPSRTEIAVIATEDRIAAELVGTVAEQAAAGSRGDAGVVVLDAAPGAYVLLAHARAADTLGRRTLQVSLRSMASGAAMSDLVAGRAWGDTVVDRAAMLEHVARDLRFPEGASIRVYTEVYGLRAAPDGQVHYHAMYEVVRTTDVERDLRRDSLPSATRLSFERQHPPDEEAREWLDVVPSVPPGRCILRLTVTRPDGSLVGRSQFVFETVRR